MRLPYPAQQLEERRRQALRLLETEKNLSAVARQVGVHRSSVLRWSQAYQKSGWEGLRARPNSGRPPRLTAQQKKRLGKILLCSPLSLGYSTDLWTLERIAQVIYREFGVQYHPHHVWRVLRNMGWSCQRPAAKAKERDEEAIRRWKSRQWPHIKKRPEA